MSIKANDIVNKSGTLLASAAHNATNSSDAVVNPIGKGVQLYLNITAKSATTTDTLQLKVEVKDPVSGTWISLGTGAAFAASTITPPSTRVAEIFPAAAAASGGVQDVINRALPALWRVTVVHVGTGTWTYSLGYAYVH